MHIATYQFLKCSIWGGTLLFVACMGLNKNRTDVTEVKTNLGPIGNAVVAAEFSAYRQKPGGCNPAGFGESEAAAAANSPKRVLLTGFGPFQGSDFNISGLVADSMGKSGFWSGVVANGTSAAVMNAVPGTDILQEGPQGDHGGKRYLRRIQVNGHFNDVCFMKLDVRWDLAAAIIVHEIERFAPDLIFMSGRGLDTASFEAAALNYATAFNGFSSTGVPLGSTNIPVDDNALILASHPPVNGQPHKVVMTWRGGDLREAVKTKVSDLGFVTVAVADARPSNIYICNNVSYVVLTALKGESVTLAGGAITLQIAASTAAAGFFHFPSAATSSPESLLAWSNILASAIDRHFH